jgi:hypothetical protein
MGSLLKNKKEVPVAIDSLITDNFNRTLNTEISKNIKYTNAIGVFCLIITIGTAFYLFHEIKSSIDEHLALFGFKENPIIKVTQYPTQAATILIFRYVTLGTIATTIIVTGLKISIACFDQSVRYTKRKLSNIFLQALYKIHSKQMVSKVTLPQLMAAFSKWTENVESAFSKVTTEKQEIKQQRKRKLKTTAK